MDIPEVKSLRWLANMFPLQIPARDDNDRLCNAIHLYCTAGADKIEAQELRIKELAGELRATLEQNDFAYANLQMIKEGRSQLAEKIKDAIDTIFDSELEREE